MQRKRLPCPTCPGQMAKYGASQCMRCATVGRSEKLKALTIGEYRNRESVKGKHRSWVHSHVRNFAREWNTKLRQQPCQNCGYSKHVELCHIRALATFADSALLSEVNDPSNLAVLCRNCHWEFDNGLLDLRLKL